jgi:hypothetical protein
VSWLGRTKADILLPKSPLDLSRNDMRPLKEDNLSIPESVRRLFWDTAKEEVDPVRHRSYVIRRIVDFGNLDDVKWMRNTYSAGEIGEVIRKSRGLSRRSVLFWSACLRIPPEEIQCLKTSFQKR